MQTYVPARKARARLGVSDDTLRRWDEKGLIKTIRTPGDRRLYDVASFISQRAPLRDNDEPFGSEQQQRICYCRVSSASQREDLGRQVEYMRRMYPNHGIITDIGSGINFRRKGLLSVLALAREGRLQELVVAYRDRLCRFAFELVEWTLQSSGVKLVVLNREVESSGNSELAEDLLAIVNVFNCRVNGRRKYASKRKEGKEKDKSSTEELKACC